MISDFERFFIHMILLKKLFINNRCYLKSVAFNFGKEIVKSKSDIQIYDSYIIIYG